MVCALSITVYGGRPRHPGVRGRTTIVGSALALCALVLGLVQPAPADASQNNDTSGEVVVRAGETAAEVSTVDGATVYGMVEDEVSSVSGAVLVNGPVGGDVRSGFGAVRVHSPVGGDVDVGFGDVYINSRVGGDVDVGRGNVLLGPAAHVSGHVSIGDGGIRREVGSVADGPILFGAGSAFAHTGDSPTLIGRTDWLLPAFLLAACGVLAAVAAPRALSATAQTAEECPVWSLAIGAASVLTAFVLCLALMISVVGIPLLVLAVPAYLAVVLFGALASAYLVGGRVLPGGDGHHHGGRSRMGHSLAVLVGSGAFAATFAIPLVGGLFVFTLAMLGTGASIRAFFQRYPCARPVARLHIRDRR